MLTRLSRGEASVKELAEPFALSAPAISKHLKVLERSGLIARRRDAQWRPCQLTAEPIVEAVAWMERCRVEQDARFDRLEAYLLALQQPEPKPTQLSTPLPEQQSQLPTQVPPQVPPQAHPRDAGRDTTAIGE
jgi:DNA-binding transcriptional ArsR family regulator